MFILSIIALTINAYAAELTHFYDAMDNMNNWTQQQPTATVHDGYLDISCAINAGIAAEAKTKDIFSPARGYNWVIEYDFIPKQVGSNARYVCGWSSIGIFAILNNNNNANKVNVMGTEYTLSAPLVANQKYHLKFKNDAATYKVTFYIDNVAVNTGGTTNGYTSGAYSLDMANGWSATTPCEALYDNVWYDRDGNLFPTTSNTNFNGYVKDENGNPIQYANVSLYDNIAETFINSALSNSAGYYDLTSIINTGVSHGLRVLPPNKGISNYYNFTLNSQTDTVTHNFTVSNLGIVLQAYDVNDVKVYLTSINVNYTVNGVWYNYSGVNNPFGLNSTIALSDNLDIYISANGYYPYHTGISSLQSGQTVITAH
jgi:hypothetical protein